MMLIIMVILILLRKKNNNKINSSLDIEAYKKLFFDDSYNIEIRGNLIEKEKTIKMVQYNVQNKKNFLTILAIRGTSYNTDIYLDSQLYILLLFY